MASRGIRNCNPGNLRLTKDKWKGLRPKQDDKAFFQFESMEWGYRAMLITLRNYRKRHGCTTIASMIRRYAPENENNTSAYMAAVCNDLQVPTTYSPNVDDKETMCRLAAAMSRVENGVKANMDKIRAGWDLI